MDRKCSKNNELNQLKLQLNLIRNQLKETSIRHQELSKRIVGLKEPSEVFLRIQKQQRDLDRLLEARDYLGRMSKLSDLMYVLLLHAK